MALKNLGRVVGKSAYETWIEAGHTGTELDFLASLIGQPGTPGTDGVDGRGIREIRKTKTEGLVDTYTIYYTDDTTSTYEVTNGSGGSGTSDYSLLTNKPSINGKELNGDKSLEDLGIQARGNYVEDALYVHTDNNYSSEDKAKLSSLHNYDDTEIRGLINNKQDKLVSGTNIKTINNESILGKGNITIEGGSATLQEPITVNCPIGSIIDGTVFPVGTPLETIIRQMLYIERPEAADLYIGGFEQPITAAQFAGKTTDELVNSKYIYRYSDIAGTPIDLTTAWGNGANPSVYYIMVKKGFEPAQAQMTSGGITSTFTQEDIKNPSIWKAVHESVTIDEAVYNIYGYRTSFNPNDIMSIIIQ